MSDRVRLAELAAGDTFRVGRGSRAGRLGVTGTLAIVELADGVAALALSVGRFGFNIDVELRLERNGDEVDIQAAGRAFDTIRTRGRIVVNTASEVRIEDLVGTLADTLLQLDEDGTAVLDSEIPRVGQVRLLLERT